MRPSAVVCSHAAEIARASHSELDIGSSRHNHDTCCAVTATLLKSAMYFDRDSSSSNQSEGFARAAYFVPGRDGMGVWPNSEIVPPPPSAPPSAPFVLK